MYAGHDGNVYKHTDSGWEKYDKGGGWNPVQPPTNRPQSGGNSNALGASQGGRGNTTGGATDRGNYQQLEQDRLGRQAGGGGRLGGSHDSGGNNRNRR